MMPRWSGVIRVICKEGVRAAEGCLFNALVSRQSLYLEEVSIGRISNYFIVVSVTRGVGQVVLERAVAVVAVEEAEVGLAAR